MRIIPAIDIINGQCVRLSHGDYEQKQVYDQDPVAVAKRFESAGLKHLHLVDLDGAKANHIVNLQVLRSICEETDLTVDFGGGVKSDEDISLAFDAGAAQVTAGSVAIKNAKLVDQWISKYGSERIILGADVKGDFIAINGWTETTAESYHEFIQKYAQKGIRSVISTDIATDGMLQGPSFKLYEQLVKSFPDVEIIASGGVASIEDVEKLDQIGVAGVIIGKAIYENRVSLEQLSAYVS